MRNQQSIEAVNAASFSREFCRPLYESYCFSRVPKTIESLLLGPQEGTLPEEAMIREDYDAVILLLVDGFGWSFFESYLPHYPFLQRFQEEGVVSKITSQFPSTTAGHVTCINTGLSVADSGIYEWFYYEPKVDRMIAPLLYSFAGDKALGTLSATGVSAEEIYPTQTVYQRLKAEGIPSYVMQHRGIADSAYSRVMFSGATSRPYATLKEGLQNLIALLSSQEKKTYYYLYFGDIDSAGHRSGIVSTAFADAVDSCWQDMEKHLYQPLCKLPKRVCTLLIADHGMVPVDPKRTHYLNKEVPEILPHLKKNREGRLLAPAGSCRDLFLHIEEGKIEEMRKLLTQKFQGIAEVHTTEALTSQGLFGPQPPSTQFLRRVGNLVVLPYEGEAVWWYEKHRFEQHFLAAHGGLTRKEMEIPFCALPTRC